jgi:hypothetical protein
MSANIGGLILPHHQFFGFFAIEPLWQSTSSRSLTTVEDAAFVSWAQQKFPNTLGTKLLTSYKPTPGAVTGVSKTAADLFPNTCGTAAEAFIPCSLPLVDNARNNPSKSAYPKCQRKHLLIKRFGRLFCT